MQAETVAARAAVAATAGVAAAIAAVATVGAAVVFLNSPLSGHNFDI